METQNIKFDYYNARFSYIRYIMESLNKSSNEQAIVGEIFNTFLSNLDNNEINEIVIYSALFEKKINEMALEERKEKIEFLYDCYIKSMMVSFSNNDIDALIFFYKGLENKIKEISCYYGIYGEDGYFNYVNNKASIAK